MNKLDESTLRVLRCMSILRTEPISERLMTACVKQFVKRGDLAYLNVKRNLVDESSLVASRKVLKEDGSEDGLFSWHRLIRQFVSFEVLSQPKEVYDLAYRNAVHSLHEYFKNVEKVLFTGYNIRDVLPHAVFACNHSTELGLSRDLELFRQDAVDV